MHLPPSATCTREGSQLPPATKIWLVDGDVSCSTDGATTAFGIGIAPCCIFGKSEAALVPPEDVVAMGGKIGLVSLGHADVQAHITRDATSNVMSGWLA